MITTTIPGDLGGRLRHYREAAGLTREHVSVNVGRGAGCIRDWELGQRAPRYVLLVQLARLYGVRRSPSWSPVTPELRAYVAATRAAQGLPPGVDTLLVESHAPDQSSRFVSYGPGR